MVSKYFMKLKERTDMEEKNTNIEELKILICEYLKNQDSK